MDILNPLNPISPLNPANSGEIISHTGRCCSVADYTALSIFALIAALFVAFIGRLLLH